MKPLSEQKNPYGRHPVYLNMPHDVYVALDNYCRQIGVPRSRVIFDVLRGFLGPLVEQQDQHDAD
jgi:hypothetical protein